MMPYSTDPNKNRDNPSSPSEFSLAEQVLYRVASLDSTVQQGFRRVDENIERLRSDFHDAQLATNDRINNIDKEFREAIAFKRARIDSLVAKGEETRQAYEKRLVALETWSKVVTAKVAVIMGVITFVAMLLAPTIRHMLGVSN